MTLRNPQTLSIRARLLLLVVFSVSTASLVSAGLSVSREIAGFAEAKRTEVEGLAAVFASMSADALARADSDAAHLVLRSMASMPGVRHVALIDNADNIVSEHGLGARLESDVTNKADGRWATTLAILSSGSMQVAMPVRHRGEEVGRIELLVATPELMTRLIDLVRNALLATLLAVAIGFVSAQRLRRGISERIGSIAGVMRQVRANHDYSLAIADSRRDEIGELAGGFNEMMQVIRARDGKLANYTTDLENEVTERTAALVEAKQQADDANAAKSQFLATMSHEIRTPMNGMLVMAELLAASDLSHRQRRYADVIVASGGSLMSIINDVLDFSKIEAGKIDLEAIPFDLADAIDNVSQLFASKAEGKGLDLAAFCAPDLGEVIGDPTRLGQVIGNLVNNAIKFTEKGHVLIKASRMPSTGGDRLRIAVTDTGIGIPEDKLATVFESFSQADQSTTRKFGGTGLGLSICQRLVEAMGGEIGVESEVGRGSTFWCEVPLNVAGTAPRAWPSTSHRIEVAMGASATARSLADYLIAPGHAAAPMIWVLDAMAYDTVMKNASVGRGRPKIILLSRLGQSRAEQLVAEGKVDALLPWPIKRADVREVVAAVAEGRKINTGAKQSGPRFAQYPSANVLVVDDSPVNREVAIEALKRFGIVPVTADGGVEALKLTTRQAYDLVLMDGSMPDLDGFETSRRIREREEETGASPMPIVALTAHVLGEGADAWKTAGMNGILGKPFTMEALGQCLAAHLAPEAGAVETTPGDSNRADRYQAEVAARDSAGMQPVPDPAAADEEDALFNADTLSQMAMMAQMAGVDAARRIYALFDEHAPPGLDALREAVVARDATAVSGAAHALKSMSLSIGASALAALLADVELNARSKGELPTNDALASVSAMLDRTSLGIRQLPFLALAGDATASCAA